MAPIRTMVSCPKCRTPVQVELEQLIDVSQDPSVKQRLMSGSINVINCPTCGFRGQASSLLVYHDNEKELLLSFVPMEMGLPQAESERIIGRLVNEVVNKLPQERRKAYLFSPRQALTMNGLMDWILEKDGVTREQLDAQRAKAQLLQRMLQANETTLPTLIQENDAQIDGQMFQILSASASRTAQSGNQGAVQVFAALQRALLEHSTFGKQIVERQKVADAAAEELRNLGDKLSPDTFMDLVLKASSNDQLAVYVSLARPLADYAFFESLTRRIERAEEPEKGALTQKRDVLLQLTQEIDAEARARLDVAAGTLRKLMEAQDLKKALNDNVEAIDDTFLALLEDQMAAAQRANRPDVLSRLQLINGLITDMIRQAAPPEVQLINELMAISTEAEAEAAVRGRAGEITPEFMQTLNYLSNQMREQNQTAAAERLDFLYGLAVQLEMEKNWSK